MDATLQALGGILLKAIPTVILLVLLNLYLRWIFFRPLEAVLKKRKEATEGARAAADASLKRATEKTAEYEAKLREARAGIYQEQEQVRRRWVEEHSKRLEEARNSTHELVRQAREDIEQQAAAAKKDLSVTAGELADEIARTLLAGRAN
jgi:F-type H+-transporting ATPase subunit b